ncbi:MAG: AAA family ATPase [Candidatus Eisenbacteria sp.]|nr:AAA family ATPase [Candidatus Eisenbacteria bacterium]
MNMDTARKAGWKMVKKTPKSAARKTARKTAKKAVKKAVRKTARKPAGRTAKKAAKRAARKTTRTVAKKVSRKTAKKAAGKTTKRAAPKRARRTKGAAKNSAARALVGRPGATRKAAARKVAIRKGGVRKETRPTKKTASHAHVDLERFAVDPADLRWRCDFGGFGFASTEELPTFEGIIGQDRAMDAIRLGLKMRSKGYNIYVAGYPGTGKMTTIRHLLKTVETGRRIPPDIVYVNNFRDSDMPRALLLPAGQGCRLRDDMKTLVTNVQRNIAQIYESEDYKERMKALIEEYKEREKTYLRDFEERIRKENFALIQVQLGPFSKPEIAPIIAGEPVQMERLDTLTHQGKFGKEEYDRLREKYEDLTTDMEKAFKASRNLKRELREAMAKIQKEFGSPAVTDYIKDLKSEYDDPGVLEYLKEAQEEILNNMERFTDGDDGEEQKKPQQGQPQSEALDDRFRDFSVNVLVDNSATKEPPMIIETSPNYRNLFGAIDRVVDRSGHWVSDFTRIKAGSLMRANGGTLVINLMDAIVEPGVWIGLKRTLKHQKIDIQSFDPFYLYSVSVIKPEPIPLDLKVVVVGDRHAYHILYNYDDDFRKIFKVKAEFDTEMRCTEENVQKYVNFARKITSEEKLLPLDARGVGALIEHGIRLAGRQNRLTTRFSIIADVIREGDLWAREAQAARIGAEHIHQAVSARDERVRLTEEKLQELIDENVILIDTEGAEIGQVNGLSVLDLGDYAFGRPSRITAKVSLGRAGIVNIDREAELSGKTHNKGVLILTGYFRSLFAGELPLAINATICFEQSYGGIDGDSASSTEMYALLSALSGVPLRQDIAVTGSMNQNGISQPIGGVNEKIEGFYEVCKARGLTGRQGVMIPQANVPDLMLKPEVSDAVRAGRFHIYAVETISQGIEILTGLPAGEPAADGRYPEDSVFGRVEREVRRFAELSRSFKVREE